MSDIKHIITILMVAASALLLGYYYGKTEIYENLHDEKIECRLVADEFVMDAMD